jgi:hypothetical protein
VQTDRVGQNLKRFCMHEEIYVYQCI